MPCTITTAWLGLCGVFLETGDATVFGTSVSVDDIRRTGFRPCYLRLTEPTIHGSHVELREPIHSFGTLARASSSPVLLQRWAAGSATTRKRCSSPEAEPVAFLKSKSPAARPGFAWLELACAGS